MNVARTPSWRTPLDIGNLTLAVERLVASLSRHPASAGRAEELAQFRMLLSAVEWRVPPDSVRAALSAASAAPSRQRAELVATLRGIPVDLDASPVGECTALFSVADSSAATALLVSADVQLTGSTSTLIGAADEDGSPLDVSLGRAFHGATRAALREIALRLGGDPHAWDLARLVSIDGYLPQVSRPLQGASVGLAIAVAALSRVSKVGIDRSDAFAARVRPDGALLGVGDVSLKVHAAIHGGAKRIFLAPSDVDEVPPRSRLRSGKVEIVPCRHLSDVLAVIDDAAFTRGITRALRPHPSRAPVVVRSEPSPPALQSGRARRRPKRHLVSFVTLHDPYPARHARARGAQPPLVAGPLLALVEQASIDAVTLLAVPALPGRERGLSTAERLTQCVARLRARRPALKIRTHMVETVKDPFDETETALALSGVLDSAFRRCDREGDEVHVHFSYLTPALHLLLDRVLARLPHLEACRWAAQRRASGGIPSVERLRRVLLL